MCIGGVFCATDVGISGSDDGWDESHVMVTHLSGDLNHLSAVSLTCDEDCNSTLRLQTVSALPRGQVLHETIHDGGQTGQ